LKKNLVLIFIVLLVSACGLTTTRPKLEMSMAQTAFMAAKESQADVKAPGLFRKAEYYYLKAKSAYKRKYFNKAQQYALLSKKYSERAEYVAIRKKTLENL
jgi:Tfp pilus assembly protein PilP